MYAYIYTPCRKARPSMHIYIYIRFVIQQLHSYFDQNSMIWQPLQVEVHISTTQPLEPVIQDKYSSRQNLCFRSLRNTFRIGREPCNLHLYIYYIIFRDYVLNIYYLCVRVSNVLLDLSQVYIFLAEHGVLPAGKVFLCHWTWGQMWTCLWYSLPVPARTLQNAKN